MSRVLFSVWFRIQRIIKNVQVLFSVRFSIQRIIKKCPGYYSASGSGFSVLLHVTDIQGIIQRMVQDSTYYSIMFRVLQTVYFSIQRIIKKYPEYYSVSSSGFSV